MFVRILVEYEVLGDNKFSYIESFNTEAKSQPQFVLPLCKLRFAKSLLSRGILACNIKVIDSEYVRD